MLKYALCISTFELIYLLELYFKLPAIIYNKQIK